MKIAFIFPKFTGPYGGERLVLKLSSELIDLGLEVTIYTHRFNNSCNSLKHKNLKIVDNKSLISKNHNVSTLLSFFYMPLLINKISSDFDIICGVGWQSAYGLYLLQEKNPEIKNKLVYYCLEPPRFLYDLQVANSDFNLLSKIFIKLLSPFIKNKDKKSVSEIKNIFSISSWTSEQVQNIYKRKSDIIYPGIEIERFKKFKKSEARKILGINQEEKIFLSVSKLHYRKRIDKALKLFKEKEDNFSKFYIIGSGPEKENLIKLVDDFKLQNKIQFLGKLSDEKLVLYNNAADYFIFTALNEPFGIAPLEAKVAGCKIIPEDIKQPVCSWKETAMLADKQLKNIISKN